MRYVLIPLLVGFLIIVAKSVRDTMRKVSSNNAERLRLFELIGKEWTIKINQKLGIDSIARNPDRKIKERFFKEQNSWLMSFPLRNSADKTEFELIVGVGQFVLKPQPHVKTLLMDMLIVTDPQKRWWISGCNSRVYAYVANSLSEEGLIFPIVESSTVSQ